MRVVLTDIETTQEWLFPGSFADLETPASDLMDWPELELGHLETLWRVLGSPGEMGIQAYSVIGVGIPHWAPGHISGLSAEFQRALCEIPGHERWRVAKTWAQEIRGQRPNEQFSQRMKTILRELCLFAQRVGTSPLGDEQYLGILPED